MVHFVSKLCDYDLWNYKSERKRPTERMACECVGWWDGCTIMVYLLTLMTVVTCVVAKAGYSCWQVVGNAACRANVMEMAIVLLRELHREIELLRSDQSAAYCVTDIDWYQFTRPVSSSSSSSRSRSLSCSYSCKLAQWDAVVAWVSRWLVTEAGRPARLGAAFTQSWRKCECSDCCWSLNCFEFNNKARVGSGERLPARVHRTPCLCLRL